MKISGVVNTINSSNRIEKCLQSILDTGFVDELNVFVDLQTTDNTNELVAKYTDRIFPFDHNGNLSQVSKLTAAQCTGDFIVRIDDDEVIGGNWDRKTIEVLYEYGEFTKFWTPRRWIVPPGDRFIVSHPWFGDFQLRIYKNDPSLRSNAREHETIHLDGKAYYLKDRWIDHLDFMLTTRQQREAKCKRYLSLNPDINTSKYYLFEDEFYLSANATPRGVEEAFRYNHIDSKGFKGSPFPEYQGESLLFDENGNGRKYQLGGWSSPEPHGTWTEGTKAVLALDCAKLNWTGKIALDVSALGCCFPSSPTTEVEVFLNDTRVADWKFALNDGFKSFYVKAENIKPVLGPSLIVTFKVNNPKCPLELGVSPDSRNLGILVQSVKIQ